MLTFGEKIKEARKHKGLTQRELAKLVDAAYNSISDWECNKNKPDANTIEKLCTTLEISPNYLMSKDSEAFSPNEISLIKRFRKLDNSGKTIVMKIIENEYEKVGIALEYSHKINQLQRLNDYYIKLINSNNIDIDSDLK